MEASQQQQQPRNEILIGTTNAVSPRTVRTNWLRYSWSQISGATKVLLIISVIIAVIQIATTVTILAKGGQQGLSCDKPLQLYLIVFVVRIGLSSPLSIYQHLFVPRTRRGRGVALGRRRRRAERGSRRNRSSNNNNSATQPQETQAAAPMSISNPEETASVAVPPLATNDSSNNNNNADTQFAQQGQQERPSTLISGWVDRLRSLLDLFGILWFIVGNYLVFSPSTCSVNAALYYYTVLAWVLFGYTILLIPLLACASVIFCLPVILVALRTFNINVSNVMVGGSKEEIAKIPIFKYRVPSTEEASSSTNLEQPNQQGETATTSGNKAEASTSSKSSAPAPATTKKSNFIRRFMKRHQKQDNPTCTTANTANIDQYLTIPNAEDALCSICLSEYENDEIICKLWCQHHFHHECCAEWLALNSKCPLCKRDFRGKDYISEEDSDFEEDEQEQV